MRNKKMRNTKAAGVVLALVLTISNVYPVMAISADKGKTQEQVQVEKKEGKIIFLDSKAGKDEADGTSEKNAVKSLDQALKLIGEKGRIILCGETKLDEAEKAKIPTGIQSQTLKNYRESLAVTTPEVTPTPGVTGAPEATPTPEVTGTPEVTPTPEVTGMPEVTPTPEVTGTPEVTPTPEVTVTPTPTPEVTVTPTPTPQITPQPGVTPTPEPTAEPEIPEESPIVSDPDTEGQQEKDEQQGAGEEENAENRKPENETKVSDIEDQQSEEKKRMAVSGNIDYKSEDKDDEIDSADTEGDGAAKAAETAKEDQLSAFAAAANTAGIDKRSIGSILVGDNDDFYQSASAGNNNNSSNKGNTSSGGGSSTSGNGTNSSNKGSNSGSSATNKTSSGSTTKKVTTQTPSKTSGTSRAYVKTGDTNQVLPLTVSSVMALLMGVSLAGMKMERKRNSMRAQAAEEWNAFHEACRF